MIRPMTDGLYGHIRRNALKSVLLLAGFVGLVSVFWYAWCVIYSVIWWTPPGLPEATSLLYRMDAVLKHAVDVALTRWWVPVMVAACWFCIAFAFHATMIRSLTRARPVTEEQQPKLYRMVENLAMTAGLPMPHLEIMNTMALNAYAAGLGPNDAVIAVTRGLIEELEDDEVEAVLAHEISHIRNYDVRLMVVAGVFAGGLTMLGDCIRNWTPAGSRPGYDNDTDEFGLPAQAFLLWVAAISSLLVGVFLLAAVHVFALMTHLAMSRSREFLADAGAVELTKNPDAMIAALQKIHERDVVPVANTMVQAMMISSTGGDFFDTHPSIADRIEALKTHAGGQIRPRKNKGRKFGTWGKRGWSGLRNGRSAPLRG
jgi:heat shock protein HtpX